LFSKNPNRQNLESELSPVIHQGEYGSNNYNYNNYAQELEEEQFSEAEDNMEAINDSNLQDEDYVDKRATIDTAEYIENEMMSNQPVVQENQVENFNIEIA
jgi:hypothetical protein